MKRNLNLIKINLQYYKLRYRNISHFCLQKGGAMNEFFKLLIPQLFEYFKDETKVLEFIPKSIEQQYKNLLIEYTKENERKETKNETTNK